MSSPAGVRSAPWVACDPQYVPSLPGHAGETEAPEAGRCPAALKGRVAASAGRALGHRRPGTDRGWPSGWGVGEAVSFRGHCVGPQARRRFREEHRPLGSLCCQSSSGVRGARPPGPPGAPGLELRRPARLGVRPAPASPDSLGAGPLCGPRAPGPLLSRAVTGMMTGIGAPRAINRLLN